MAQIDFFVALISSIGAEWLFSPFVTDRHLYLCGEWLCILYTVRYVRLELLAE
jgi:hypothetical protein